MNKGGKHYVYFLQSLKNNKIYTGSTSRHPKERAEEHNQGLNIWTKQNGPFRLVYFEEYCCKEDSIAREIFFKSGFGRKIRNAILNMLAQFPPEADPSYGGGRA